MSDHDYSHLPEPPNGICYGTVARISFNPDGKVMMSVDNPTGRSLHFWKNSDLLTSFGVEEAKETIGRVIVLASSLDEMGFHNYKILGLCLS